MTSGMVAGGLAGFVLGVPWEAAGAGTVPYRVAAALVAAALLLDGLAWRRPGWRPPSVRRQVPREWGRLFGARGAAVLYGARLGVGPLTILRSWLWWAGTIVLATASPWWSAAGGAVYAMSALALIAATASAMGPDGTVAAPFVARVRAMEARVLLATTGGMVLLGAVLA